MAAADVARKAVGDLKSEVGRKLSKLSREAYLCVSLTSFFLVLISDENCNFVPITQYKYS